MLFSAQRRSNGIRRDYGFYLYDHSVRVCSPGDPPSGATVTLRGLLIGMGCALGDGIFGIDIDACCDAITGKFTQESREIVIVLDTYTEYSYSGDGCHLLGLGGDGAESRPNLLILWCREGDLNPHRPFGPADFKFLSNEESTV